MRILKEGIEQAASSRSSALITGESGTGKELVAKAIHFLSNRSNRPFQAINCGALPDSLLEDELFGHIKGSFTGAISNKRGLFVEAQGGTIFLDELGEMPAIMQVKLLRVLQERKVRPLGSTESRELDIDVRVVAATNRNLRLEMEKGSFRQDLYFRLNVFELHLPALRERTADIPMLAEHLLKKVVVNAGLSAPASLSEEAASILCRYRWPGNVRELENLLERLSVAAGSGNTITADQVSLALSNAFSRVIQGVPKMTRSDIDLRNARGELEIYENALQQTNWNYSEAARKLRMKRTTFYYRLNSLRAQLDGDT